MSYSTLLGRSIISFMLIAVITSCNTTPDAPVTAPVENTQPSVDEGNAAMVKVLQEAWAKTDPANITYYLNNERYKALIAETATQEGPTKINTQIKAANELLNSGETESAILFLQQIIQEVQKKKLSIKSSNVLLIRKLIGISYMRLGEEENCIAKEEGSVCIIPFAPEAIHKIERGSRTAIDIYKSILKEYPSDLESIWLLNLAYMTLGEYPDQVPKKYLIDPSEFKGDTNFKKFINVAQKNNTAILSLSGGGVVEDFNNDGLLDIITSGWGINDPIQVLMNSKTGFVNKTSQSKLQGITGGLNMIQGDYNNDGFVDLFVLRGAWFNQEGEIPNSLLKNNGDGTFSDVTIAAGLLSFHPTQTAAFADFNLDGHLDLVIGNENNPLEYFLNQEDGTFKNETEEAGLSEFDGFTKGIAVGDINNDNYPDIYLSNYLQGNKLLLNTGGQNPLAIKFVDVTEFSGTAKPVFSFPTWFFDYNNDGLEDLFVGGYPNSQTQVTSFTVPAFQGDDTQGPPIKLYKNNGDNTFAEVSEQLGLTEPHAIMGSNIGDLDNDGWKDFYLGTGGPQFQSIVPNRMFRNKNGQGFSDVTFSGGFGHIQKGNSISFADFDNDGDQDVYAVMGGNYEGDKFQNVLFKNPYEKENNWIKIRLEGTASNRLAIGAKIKIEVQDGSKSRNIYHVVSSGGSFGGNPLLAEIGLGKAKKIKSLEIIWPFQEESISTFENIDVNQLIKIVEEEKEYSKQNIIKAPLKN